MRSSWETAGPNAVMTRSGVCVRRGEETQRLAYRGNVPWRWRQRPDGGGGEPRVARLAPPEAREPGTNPCQRLWRATTLLTP